MEGWPNESRFDGKVSPDPARPFGLALLEIGSRELAYYTESIAYLISFFLLA